jgi:hydrogenase maturation protease
MQHSKVNRATVLVAGIGNIFLGDDGFGCEVVKRLASRNLPPDVRVVDFGIRGFDLGYALLDDYDLVILVDATPRGGSPGTLYQIEPELDDLRVEKNSDPAVLLETHHMVPVKVLAFAQFMGASLKRIVVVGCEPENLEDDADGAIGLSASVACAVDEAVSMVESIVSRHRNRQGKGEAGENV